MRTVELNALEDFLDDCLRVVAEGETILITETGQVIAEIRPPRSPGMPQEPNDT
jgi:antitoxin (DNA-binding transcriptional repressor) of toxin-antitoxin stability system